MTSDITKYYSINSPELLKAYLQLYVDLVETVAKWQLHINLQEKRFEVDHLGFQVASPEQFDKCSQILSKYSEQIRDTSLHDRRNRFYAFNKPFIINNKPIKRIEIYEPKPGVDPKTLRPGIEHIAYKVDEYESFFQACKGGGCL